MDEKELVAHIENGYVNRQWHPTLPLCILNYSKKCQYEYFWDNVTRQTRGLIYNFNTNEVISRCMTKFLNYTDESPPKFTLSIPPVVTDKLDGSMITYYRYYDGDKYWPGLASRGSFTSEQAVWAAEIWADKYHALEVPLGLTPIFELIYPSNRIVCNYKDLKDLFYWQS